MAKVRITAGARKHRIASSRIIAALDGAELVGAEGDQLHYVGEDKRGIELHMVVVPDDKRPGEWACIHAMPTYYRAGHDDDEEGE
ncbi:hypothetical protein [Microlunatus speluncae]|uniref:hypothetical protein n=1 Tax=Microlunatus speluncae TaxID=2594267 RepID=UPI001266432A|nr:hypothetical protein [Microlunatus speluncae]